MVPSSSAQSCAVGSPSRPGSEQDRVVTFGDVGWAGSEVDDELVHADAPDAAPQPTIDQHVNATAQAAEDTVGVADRQQRQRGVAVGDPGVAVRHAVARPAPTGPGPQGISASSPGAAPCRPARGWGSARTPRYRAGPCRRRGRGGSSLPESCTGGSISKSHALRRGPASACRANRCACRSLSGLSGSSPCTRCDMMPRS